MTEMNQLKRLNKLMVGGVASLLMVLSVFIAEMSTNGACWLLLNQPKVPKALMK